MLMLSPDRIRPAWSPVRPQISNSQVTISGQMASPTAHGSLHSETGRMNTMASRSKGWPAISQNYRSREGYGQ
jgi:hypothetical protein